VTRYVSAATARTNVNRHAKTGEKWLKTVDTAVTAAAQQLGLSNLVALHGGTMTVVVAGTDTAGNRVVIKANPDHDAAVAEADSLTAWAPYAPAVLMEPTHGVFAMAFVDAPAEHGALGEDAIDAILPALRTLESSPPHGALLAPGPVVYKIVARLAAYDATLGARFNEIAPSLVAALEHDLGCCQLVGCHGDLNAGNTLMSSPLTLIDPLPITAPLGYDIGYWATCPHRGPGVLNRLNTLTGAFPLAGDLRSWALLGAGLHLAYHTHHQVALHLVPSAHAILVDLLRS